MLVGKGLHVDGQDKEGMTPFLQAANNGHDESLQVLLRLGANLHHTTSHRSDVGSSALTLAANNGYDKAVATLLQMRADVHYADKDGDTALALCGNRPADEYEDQVVEAKKFAEIAALLLAANAQVDHQNKKGFTPLVEAAESGRLEVVTVLLQAKANVNHRTKKRLTALAFAAKHEHGDVCRALLTAGAEQSTRQPGCLPRHRTRRVADYDSSVGPAALGSMINIPQHEHTLTLTVRDASVPCDLCDQPLGKSRRSFCCKRCEYDVCLTCAELLC